MFSKCILSSFFAVAFAGTVGRATPIDTPQSFVPRDNNYHLKCGNAPDVTAGDLLDPSDYQLGTGLSNSGSDQEWFKYLYCTVGTKTYTFFGLGELNPAAGPDSLRYHNVYSAFTQAAATVQFQAQQQGDGPIGDGWKFLQSDTNVVLEVKDSKGKITYGILHSFLTGMADATLNYNPDNQPMVFQINDGQWGEVGIGYAGYLDNNGQCLYEITPQESSPCSDVLNGKVIN
ncbi:hypothetical protein ACLMJK_001118 [Lecanora helva]